MSKYLEMVEKEAEKLLSRKEQCVAHRIGHVKRVMKNALEIAKNYPNVDKEVLQIAILLHDICQPFNRKKKTHVEMSVKIAKKILRKIKYPEEKTRKVLEIISQHSTEKLCKPR